MSLGTILLVILIIALLGGFSGYGGGPFVRHLLRFTRRHTVFGPHKRQGYVVCDSHCCSLLSIRNVLVGALNAVT